MPPISQAQWEETPQGQKLTMSMIVKDDGSIHAETQSGDQQHEQDFSDTQEFFGTLESLFEQASPSQIS